ncbi:hypothetical protein GOACH_14_00040 [Gordonia aichiensis NBRC 108223]|uniref:Uncharacterized protein n=2 Tax=Gordonia aichiensis TaxID=36820 RepID=L7KLL6_9ACTN|nr:hypothetical protein GOACH_14_00040 [Gordonia aichiensis NBRC 108223]
MTLETIKRRRRYILGVYDRPILRDWLFWTQAACTVLFSIILLFPTAENAANDPSTPVWVDSLVGGPVMGFIFFYPVGVVRRLFRAFRERNRTTSSPISVTPTSPQTPSSTIQPAQHWDYPVAHPEKPMTTAPSSFIPTDLSQSAQPVDDRWLNESAPGWSSPNLPSIGAVPSNPPAPASTPPIQSYPTPQNPTHLTSPAQSDTVFDSARIRLPYPIARSVRAYQMSSEPLQQYGYLLDIGESVTICVGAVAAAWMRDHCSDHPEFKRFLQGMDRGLSHGSWHPLITAAASAMAEHSSALDNYVPGVTSSKKMPALVDILREVVEERNRWAHGSRPTTKGEAMARTDTLKPVLDRALKKASFLGVHRWILVRHIEFDRRYRKFEASVGVAMGDHPDFEISSISTNTPLALDNIYSQSQVGFIDLAPFIVYRYCSHCHSPEMFFTDRLKDNGAVLKSFARGHEEFDEAIFAEFAALRSA